MDTNSRSGFEKGNGPYQAVVEVKKGEHEGRRFRDIYYDYSGEKKMSTVLSTRGSETMGIYFKGVESK